MCIRDSGKQYCNAKLTPVYIATGSDVTRRYYGNFRHCDCSNEAIFVSGILFTYYIGVPSEKAEFLLQVRFQSVCVLSRRSP